MKTYYFVHDEYGQGTYATGDKLDSNPNFGAKGHDPVIKLLERYRDNFRDGPCDNNFYGTFLAEEGKVEAKFEEVALLNRRGVGLI